MPAQPHTPTVRARALGARLAQLRISHGLSPEQVAASVGDSRFKVRNVEMAKVKVKPAYLHALLDLYGVDSGTRAALADLAKNAWRRGWWTEYSDVFQGSFVALEDQAARIRSWQPQLVPGLLQTEDYAREVIRAGLGDVPRSEVDRRWQARLNRQALLTREENPPHLDVVLDEAILERPIGGREVMRHQLHRIAKMAQQPNVTVRILPKAAGAHAGLEGPLVILSYPEEVHPDIAYVEVYPGDVYLESQDEVRRSNVTMQRIQEAALGQDESVALIRRLAAE